jgi:hypothetical protein
VVANAVRAPVSWVIMIPLSGKVLVSDKRAVYESVFAVDSEDGVYLTHEGGRYSVSSHEFVPAPDIVKADPGWYALYECEWDGKGSTERLAVVAWLLREDYARDAVLVNHVNMLDGNGLTTRAELYAAAGGFAKVDEVGYFHREYAPEPVPSLPPTPVPPVPPAQDTG